MTYPQDPGMNKDKATLPSTYLPLLEVDKAKIKGSVNNSKRCQQPITDEARALAYKTRSYDP